MKQALVYQLKCPIDNSIKYIGVTTKKLKERLTQHMYTRFPKNLKESWIITLKEKNLKPVIEELFLGTLDECKKEETRIIKNLLISGVDLLNSTLGGDGIVLKRTYKSIKKSSEAKYKPIVQLTLNGELIQKYNSIKEACNKLGVKRTAIGNCLKKRSKSSHGYLWEYLENYDSSISYKHPIIKPIAKYSKEGKFLTWYNTVDEAVFPQKGNARSKKYQIKLALNDPSITAQGCYYRYYTGDTSDIDTSFKINKYIVVNSNDFNYYLFTSVKEVIDFFKVNNSNYYRTYHKFINSKIPINNFLIYSLI